MTGTWSQEQVLALSPDASSTSAGRKLAGPAPWSETGSDAHAVWGFCKGSGAKPYQTVVDLDGPAFKCSCPSRKFPCKHALGLLLLWADGGVATAGQPAYVEEWLASRGQRAEKAATRSESKAAPDPAAQAARAAQRVDRVTAGLEDLDVWLCDQVRSGLAGLQSAGYAPFERMAARMVDAQAPGVASMLRALPASLVGGEDWPARTLEGLAQVRLVVQAHRRLDALPEDLAANVRSRVGYTTSSESVLELPPVRDRWWVLGAVDTVEYRLSTRRIWLRGEQTDRFALLLFFAPPGQPLARPVWPGLVLDADVHFYPGAGQHRALLGTEHTRTSYDAPPPAMTVVAATQHYAELVAADPWADRLPVVLEGAVGPPTDGWWLQDDTGAVPLQTHLGDPWPLLALSMGDEVRVFGELGRHGFLPLACLTPFTTTVLSA